MPSLFNFIKKKIGIDGAIFYTSLARLIQAGTGVITIFFVVRFLTPIEQGFYYTFGSVIAIQVFFELGFNGIITQYIAHEVSHLKWFGENEITGPQQHLSRLSSLLHFTFKWYLIFAFLLLVVLMICGYLFFKIYDNSEGKVIWFAPWIIIAVTTTIAFLINPVLAIFEGLGKVKQVALIRLIQQLFITLILWGSLFFGAKLYASGISSLISLLLIFVVLFYGKQKKILIHIWNIQVYEKVNYKKEIFPYQWKIALSWVSGYFIFQLFNPVLFATEGSIIAGQMGMTLTVLNGLFSLSISWMSTKVPLYSGLIAQKKYSQLDSIFNKTLTQSVIINGFGLVFMFIGIYGLKHFGISLGNRFLPLIPLIFMMVPIFLNQFVSSWAMYLRCHKQEPYLVLSIVGGISIALSTIFFGNNFGVIGMTSGYCILTFFIMIWGYYIFRRKKIEWHGE